MNAKQLTSKREWSYPFLDNVPHEVINVDILTSNSIRFGREVRPFAIGHSGFVHARPIHINDYQITDPFQYMQYLICTLLEADFGRQAKGDKPIRIINISQLDEGYFRSSHFPLVIWRVDKEDMDIMVRGYVWVDKSTVEI
jgi:hypothetical protein